MYIKKAGLWTAVLFVFTVSIILAPARTYAQTLVGTISSPAATNWIRIALYQTGGKLFIADNTNAQILVYDANSLGYLGTISLTSFLPSRPQTMAVHNGTGTLYVVVDTGMATSDSTIVIINTATNSIVDTITNIGWAVGLGIDESRARLYTIGNIWTSETLTAIDCTTNGIVGSLNITSLMGSGSLVYSTDHWLNPLTGELAISNLHYDKFVVVNGPAMTGELISATDSRGYACTWNPQENKIYITTVDWNGYFIYDRDTKTSSTTSCINDGTMLFYSQATNRIYSGAEVNGKTTVIEGATDACQNVDLEPGLSKVGFITATHHAYFAGVSSIKVLDEDTLTVVDTIPNCNPSAYGGTDEQVIVNQAKGRVFIRSYWSSPSEGSCVRVIEEQEAIPLKEDLLGTWDGQGVYYRNSDTGAWVKLASPADLIACGDLYGDGIDDLIGIWPGQAGVWVKNSANGSWAYLGSTPRHIAAGDMNGDGRMDLLGTWDGQGVFYRDSIGGGWTLMATPATLITTGDLDGDGKADLIGIWPSQAGVWVKYSKTGNWSYIGSSPKDMATGDMNGDGRVDLVGTWDSQGVFYRDSMTGSWVMMATPADQIAAGDLDGDGTDDLIGIWAGQAGVWVKYSATGQWTYIGSSARDIAVGKMSGGVWNTGLNKPMPLNSPTGGFADGPSRFIKFEDLSSEGPGGNRFLFKRGEDLVPRLGKSEKTRFPGPGEAGFRYALQKNLWPQGDVKK